MLTTCSPISTSYSSDHDLAWRGGHSTNGKMASTQRTTGIHTR
ncbi:hypothetical protein D805_0702 [Bifidobacterium thermophilum RBL67]|uniref:Uncharacterized protein n=1 Tax=Bifidobacterium thermophilum RBL67 TaxID=1254439 RepID=M4RFN0_9BIFI|nr:hypothetical protein D805_0702 [Bifidobacterium thermophilum RBL67]